MDYLFYWGKHQLKQPILPGTTVTICMSYFVTESPGKEHRTKKPWTPGIIQEKSKGDSSDQVTCPTNLPENFLLVSIVAEEGPWVRIIGQRQPRN